MNMKRVFTLAAAAVLLAPPAYAAAKATVHMSGKVTGLREGTLTISAPPFVATSALAQRETVSLTTATESIAIPSGTTAIAIVMPAGNTNTVDVTGGRLSPADSHIHLSGTAYWAFLPLASGATLVASASATTAVTVWFF